MPKQKENVKFRNNTRREMNISYKHELVIAHFFECYEMLYNHENKKIQLNIYALVRHHKKFIHKTNLVGKNRYKTFILLQNYINAKNKNNAMSILTNTVNNMGLFRKNIIE